MGINQRYDAILINEAYLPDYTRYKKQSNLKLSRTAKKRIVLISDSHITAGGMFNKKIFETAVEEIKNIKDKDYVIHLGDLTQSGTYLEYKYALECIKDIRDEKFRIIPGNHDAKNVGYLIFEELFDSRSFTIEDDDLFIVGFDCSVPDLDTGRIGMQNLATIGEMFKNVKNKIKILCFHHHLIPIPLTGRERSSILDGGDALEMIMAADIDIVLNGHRHISNVYSCTNGENEVIIFNAGTVSCNKTRYKELFSYTIMDINTHSVHFSTKQIMDQKTITRARYINRKYNAEPDAAEKKLLLKLVHIGNTHFSADNFLDEIYQEAVRQINALEPDLVIHSGDVTDSNKLSEFEVASSKLNHLRAPVCIVPGQRDLQNFGWELFPGMIGSLEPVFENDKLRVIGINSVDCTLENGLIGRKKMFDTVNLLKEKPPGRINVVTFYHSVIPHPNTKFDSILSDAGAVLKHFTFPQHNIHILLCGQDHISFALQIEETVISSCGTLSSSEYLDLNGNTYNIITCYADGFAEIERVYVRSNKKERIGRYWINWLNHKNGKTGGSMAHE